jgi:hypothetical protein
LLQAPANDVVIVSDNDSEGHQRGAGTFDRCDDCKK